MADITRTENIPKPGNITSVKKVSRKTERAKQREKPLKDKKSGDNKDNNSPKDHIDVYA